MPKKKRKAAWSDAYRSEIEYLVNIHGEIFRRIITGFVKLCHADGQSCLLSFPAGRELAVRDLIFRLAPPDNLEKHKEPRAPDWLLESHERIRIANNYVHEINQQGDEIKRLGQELEQVKGKIGQPVRRRLPDTRIAVTHKFNIGGHEGYMTVGMFDDGQPGELFVTMAKEGSTIGGLMDTIGTLTSIALQYGVSIETLARKFSHQRFEPSGYTSNNEIKMASSVIDYVFRWLEIYFLKSRTVIPVTEEQAQLPAPTVAALPPPSV